MNIGMTTGDLASRYGDRKALRLLKQSGFECVDYSGFKYSAPADFDRNSRDFAEYYNGLRAYSQSIGISIHQTHTTIPCFSLDPEKARVMFDIAVSAIYASARLGAEYIVLHPITLSDIGGTYKEKLDFSVEYFKKLEGYLKDAGIKGAVENVYARSPETHSICAVAGSLAKDIAYISDMSGDSFCNCLDIGHLFLTGEDFMNAASILADRIKVLHVHDNDGVNDNHTAPFECSIQWEKVCDALKSIGYNGVFNFEADGFLARLPDEMVIPRLEYLYKMGRYLAGKIEKQ